MYGIRSNFKYERHQSSVNHQNQHTQIRSCQLPSALQSLRIWSQTSPKNHSVFSACLKPGKRMRAYHWSTNFYICPSSQKLQWCIFDTAFDTVIADKIWPITIYCRNLPPPVAFCYEKKAIVVRPQHHDDSNIRLNHICAVALHKREPHESHLDDWIIRWELTSQGNFSAQTFHSYWLVRTKNCIPTLEELCQSQFQLPVQKKVRDAFPEQSAAVASSRSPSLLHPRSWPAQLPSSSSISSSYS